MTQGVARNIVVLGTGGTIAGVAERPGDHVGYHAAQLSIESLLSSVPSLDAHVLAAEQVAQLDSRNMDAGTWQRLALRCGHWLAQDAVAGLVITHGTDTLEETAYFLHLALAAHKPVVLTCAMRPATALFSDGPQNLLDAVAVARDSQARGVLVVCAGTVHTALHIHKRHSYALDAFDSGEAGPLAKVEEGRVRMLLDAWPLVGQTDLAHCIAGVPAADWPRVEIVLNHAGASGALVDALVAQRVDGIVAAGTGNGTLSDALTQALLRAQLAGVAVLRTTRCERGHVLEAGESALAHAAGLSPVKARIALMLRLLLQRTAS